MAFVQAHLMAILSIWTITHVILSAVSANVPPTSTLGKIAHVWTAINPLDVVKAFKAIGAELTVPLGPAVLVLCLLAGGVSACKPAVSPEPAPVEAARAAEKAAAAAFASCLAMTGLADKVQGQTGVQITIDEIKTCGPDLLALGTAAVRLHQAETVATADAGGTSVTVVKP